MLQRVGLAPASRLCLFLLWMDRRLPIMILEATCCCVFTLTPLSVYGGDDDDDDDDDDDGGASHLRSRSSRAPKRKLQLRPFESDSHIFETNVTILIADLIQ